MSALIEFEEVCKYYQMGDTTVKAADHITMKIDKGEFVAIVGQSGSGKSTCMNIIGCLDVPTHGVYRLNGRDVGKMSRNELASVRNEMLGFIFQQYNLLPRLNLMENVEVPLVYAGVSRAERHARAREVLEQVGLGDKLKNRPNQLSGGQQQRVSIARALVRNPPVILADEPTGALDSHTGREVLGLLQQLHKQGHTVVLITHDNSIAVQADRIIRLEDGRVVYDGDSHAPEAMVQPTLQAGHPERVEQQAAHLSDHAGHHHRRDGGHRHRGSGQRYDQEHAGQFFRAGHQHPEHSGLGLRLPYRTGGRYVRHLPAALRPDQGSVAPD